jgi:hypothetical protein
MDPIAAGPGKVPTPPFLASSGLAQSDSLTAAASLFLGTPRRRTSLPQESLASAPARLLDNLRSGLLSETAETRSCGPYERRDAKTGLPQIGLGLPRKPPV